MMKVSLDCFVCSFQCVHLVHSSLKVCGILSSLKIKFKIPTIVLISLLPGSKVLIFIFAFFFSISLHSYILMYFFSMVEFLS